MIFGISSKVMRDYKLEEAISIAGKYGYDAIEIWIDDFISSGLTPDQIIELTDTHNLKRTVHLRTDDLNICSFNEGIRNESVKQIKEGIFIASQIKRLRQHFTQAEKHQKPILLMTHGRCK